MTLLFAQTAASFDRGRGESHFAARMAFSVRNEDIHVIG